MILALESTSALSASGFAGGVTIAALRSSGLAEVPTDQGVYVVWREALSEPAVRPVSTGGWFKGRDPSVSLAVLQVNWVAGTHVVYVGKADAGASARRGLRVRLGEYLRFGAGAPIGHWGGRLLWHLADSPDLRVYWKPVAAPRLEESRLLEDFVSQYGQLPFANLQR